MAASNEVPEKLPGANDHDKLAALAELTYTQQAIWFLNGFWDQFGDDAEKIWNWAESIAKFDLEKGKHGCGVDELNAHRFLESFHETMTVREMRTALRSVGALSEQDRPKLVPLVHFILVKLKVDWHKLVNASQGSNQEEMREARRQLEVVQAAFDESNARAAAAKAAFEVAAASERAALAAEAPFKAAQEEVETALAEVQAQESLYHGKIADARQRSETGGVVSRGKAANELAQLLAEDPLPLRKAKITLEAAQKKAEKARAPFLAAREIAEADRARAEEAKDAADRALDNAAKAVAEAEAYLDEVSKKGGSPLGAIWWMQRTLTEQKKFLPTSRGGTAR